MRRKRTILVLACIAAVTIAQHATAEKADESALEALSRLGVLITKSPGEPMDFELKDIDGDSHRLSSYQGKVVFLNFWATWCGPCRAEMPSMQRLYEELGDEGFVILAVNLQEKTGIVEKFIDEYRLTFPVLMDISGGVGALYAVRSIPTTYLIDQNGKVFGGLIGTREWDTPELIDVFRRILEEGVVW